MNSPYMGNFTVSQKYKPGEHNGLDLVGYDSKGIHSTVDGTVIWAGWENSNDHSQGFGQYVAIKSNADGKIYYFGHLSEVEVSLGQNVKCTDVIGTEGSTGKSTGSHCHYEIRSDFSWNAVAYDVSEISGIPNREWETFNDGYIGQVLNQATQNTEPTQERKKIKVTIDFDEHTYSGLLEEI